MEKVVLNGVLCIIFIAALAVTFNFVSPYLAFIFFFVAIYFLVKAVSAYVKRNSGNTDKK